MVKKCISENKNKENRPTQNINYKTHKKEEKSKPILGDENDQENLNRQLSFAEKLQRINSQVNYGQKNYVSPQKGEILKKLVDGSDNSSEHSIQNFNEN